MRLLIDINNLIYRSAFKLHLTDAEGRPTSAIYGVLRALGNFADTYRPEEIIICWDNGHKYRTEIYPNYKANRHREPKIKAAVSYQSRVLRELLSKLPVIQIMEQDCEADDIIAVLAKFLHIEKIGIVTGDRDLYCLAHERCTLIDPHGTKSELLLPPEDYLTSKILVGDPSDNVKGILNIGPVTARKLISEYKTIDAILKYAEHEDRLGDMTYKTSKEIIERNKLLLTPGLILPKDKVKKILDQYRFQRLDLKLNSSAFRSGLMEHGILSIVSRLSGWLKPFEKMQITRMGAKTRLDCYEKTKAESNAKAKEKNTSKDTSSSIAQSSNTNSGNRQQQTRYICKVNKRYPKILKTVGRSDDQRFIDTVQQRAAETLTRLREKKSLGLAASSNGLGARRALQNGDGQARNGRAGLHTSSIFDSQEVLSRQSVSESALPVLQSYQSEDKWKWLKSRPTADLYRVKALIDFVLGKKRIARDDAEFLLKLENEYQLDMPTWMLTKEELKKNAGRIIRHKDM